MLGYRAEEELRILVERLLTVLDADGVDYELVLVANYWPANGDDPTPQSLRPSSRATGRGSASSREEKQGAMGWDMRSGFEAATGEYLVVIDGDAQNPVEDVLAHVPDACESAAST